MRYIRTFFLFCGALSFNAWCADVPTPLVSPPKSAFIEKPITKELLSNLRKGGYILYMRHGNTDNSRPDRVPTVDLNDCNTQRPLSDAGRELMKQIGVSLRQAKLPFSEILVSPFCRAKESAQLSIGEKFEISEPLMYSVNMTSEEKKPRLEALKQIMLKPVRRGGNRLLVAHAPNMDDLIGFFVKPEGTILVFRPGSPEGYEYLASIHPDDWANLLK